MTPSRSEKEQANGPSSSFVPPSPAAVPERLSFEDLLRRLDVDLLPEGERCPWCSTLHPRYSLAFTGNRTRPSSTESVPFYLWVLSATPDGQAQASLPVLFDGHRLLDSENGRLYARVIDHAVEQPYTCQQKMEQARLAYEDAMSRVNTRYMDRMERVLTMLAPGYQWDKEEEDQYDLLDNIRELVRIEYTNGGSPTTAAGQDDDSDEEDVVTERKIARRECGNFRLPDTPKALYRLFYVFAPASVSFTDMYKECLLILGTPDGRFSVAVHFFKYELGLYCWAEAPLVIDQQADRWMCVRTGVPGDDNGLSIQHPEGLLFFRLVRTILEREWDIYPGNNFRV